MAEFNLGSQPLTSATAVTKMAGDLNADNFDQLEDEFNKLLESGVLGLILDLSGLDSVSSAGLGAIVNMSRVLADRKGKLVVAVPRPKIQGLLDMLGLEGALTVADSMEQARRLISSIR